MCLGRAHRILVSIRNRIIVRFFFLNILKSSFPLLLKGHMPNKFRIILQSYLVFSLLFLALLLGSKCSLATVRTEFDPLPSWNEGNAKQAILEFVQEST